MPRPIALEIHASSLAHNLGCICAAVSPGPVWAVVKARGYGLGGLGCGETLSESGPRATASLATALAQAAGLAVLDLQEAQALRDSGWTRPLLLLEGPFEPADIAEACRLGADVVIHQELALEWLEAQGNAGQGAPSRLWIKLNTGMNRLGFRPEQWHGLRPRLDALRQQGAALGFMTHFADAEHPETLPAPTQRFAEGLAALGWQLPEPLSMANSAGSLLAAGVVEGLSRALLGLGLPSPSRAQVWSRAGIAVYGGGNHAGLRPATRLVAQVIAVQEVPAGEQVGYGGAWTAARASRIAVVSAGYADGLPRALPTGTQVWVEGVAVSSEASDTPGQMAPLVGRVSMDMVTLDITDHPGAGVGSQVEFWGPSAPIESLAQACGTISYELLTAVTARVPRRWLP